MLSVFVVCVGTLKESYLKDAVHEYAKRLCRFCKMQVVEVAESTPEKEKDDLLKQCRGYKIALCVEGKQISSEQLAQKIADVSMQHSSLTFIIGSSTGLDDSVKKAADMQLSFSPMTFPHQLMRVILMEQIYRAFTINHHIKYHK